MNQVLGLPPLMKDRENDQKFRKKAISSIEEVINLFVSKINENFGQNLQQLEYK